MKQIIYSISILIVVFLSCSSDDPSTPPHGKEYFAGTWQSDNGCFNKFEFTQPNAHWFINYRECLSDTITDPSQLIDSCYFNYVQDSFVVNDFKSWDINEIDSTINLYDTCIVLSVKVPSVTTFIYETISDNQFYLSGVGSPNKILFTKQ